jgi:lipopolysaccharide export LptBFGC system permease protein LptF
MFEDILEFVRRIDWTGYQVSVFEVLLVVFALIKKFNVLSLLILGIVLGKGFYVVQQNTDFTGALVDTAPFIVYSVCAMFFFIYAVIKLFQED